MTVEDILTSSGKYPARERSSECTQAVRDHAAILAKRVDGLLSVLGLHATVSSGFRTNEANKEAHGAVSSPHLSGEAVDLVDPDGSLAEAILSHPNLLEDCKLYMENPVYTKGWVHLQTRPTKCGRRIFAP